jgi:Gpi18-like mannosyltransferase
MIRVAGGTWIYHTLSTQNGIPTRWFQSNPPSASWLELFHAWDSVWFVSIAQKGYYHPAYAFLPAYPILIRLGGLVTGDYWSSAFLVSSFFALASLIAFQLLANEYMGKTEALYATILMATFPYIALFTTLAYSESLFLFSTLTAWYLFRKQRMLSSSLFAALSALTRSYGVLIIIPMIMDIWRRRNYRSSLYLAVPLLALLSWSAFCFFATGNPFASWTDENYWRLNGMTFGTVQGLLLPSLSGVNPSYYVFDPILSLLAMSLLAYLLASAWKIDKALWIYAATLFVALLFVAPIMSLPRYLAFVFPIWLTPRIRSPVAVVFSVCFFVVVFLIMWLSVLQGIFIA